MNTIESNHNELITPSFTPVKTPLSAAPACELTVPTDAAVTTNPPRKRRRWGAIQRLPSKVRVWLNNALRDGLTHKQIFAGLAQQGITDISAKQLSSWSNTGYADWLRDQQHFEKLVLTTDAARIKKAPRTNRKNYRDLADLDVAVLLNNAAREFNLEKLREDIHAKPDAFFRLVTAQALHERNAILRDRNEIELKKVAAKNKAKKRAAAPKAIPSRMDIERYKRELKIVAPEHQPIEYREPTTSLTPA